MASGPTGGAWGTLLHSAAYIHRCWLFGEIGGRPHPSYSALSLFFAPLGKGLPATVCCRHMRRTSEGRNRQRCEARETALDKFVDETTIDEGKVPSSS